MDSLAAVGFVARRPAGRAGSWAVRATVLRMEAGSSGLSSPLKKVRSAALGGVVGVGVAGGAVGVREPGPCACASDPVRRCSLGTGEPIGRGWWCPEEALIPH